MWSDKKWRKVQKQVKKKTLHKKMIHPDFVSQISMTILNQSLDDNGVPFFLHPQMKQQHFLCVGSVLDNKVENRTGQFC